MDAEKNEDNTTLITNLSNELMKKSLFLIKNAKELPHTRDDWDYYSSFQKFRRVMKLERKKIFDLISKLLQFQGVKKITDNVDILYEQIVDANDQLLERANTILDDLQGIKKVPDPVILTSVTQKIKLNNNWNKTLNKTQNETIEVTLLTGKNIPRPQLKFKVKVDNSTRPFVPIIKDKPNFKKPLSILVERDKDGQEVYSHPYEYELMLFHPKDEELSVVTIQNPKSLEETPLIFVDTVEKLQEMLHHLRTEKEFGIDLEHHSYRSYLGLTCLMQISTSINDYLIDTLELRDELECLNIVLTDDKIVKIFHGATNDIEWLQRDFGLYVVNMFDTFIAAHALGKPQLSFASLLYSYCQVTTNKKFQLADWRIRPLTDKMIDYARLDTHFLIYIYNRLRNELIECGGEKLLKVVWERSRLICCKRYYKPMITPTSHLELYERSRKQFNARQLFALKDLYFWRDKVAREYDESLGYVLPNHMLITIAETLPREMQGILACCNPIPPLVKQCLLELHHIILQAREQSLTTIITGEELPLIECRPTVDINSIVHCPHEKDLISTQTEFKEHPSITQKNDKWITKIKPFISIFEESKNCTPKNIDSFMGPYCRYIITKNMNSSQAVNEKNMNSLDNKQNTFMEIDISTTKSEDDSFVAANSISNAKDNEQNVNKKNLNIKRTHLICRTARKEKKRNHNSSDTESNNENSNKSSHENITGLKKACEEFENVLVSNQDKSIVSDISQDKQNSSEEYVPKIESEKNQNELSFKNQTEEQMKKHKIQNFKQKQKNKKRKLKNKHENFSLMQKLNYKALFSPSTPSSNNNHQMNYSHLSASNACTTPYYTDLQVANITPYNYSQADYTIFQKKNKQVNQIFGSEGRFIQKLKVRRKRQNNKIFTFKTGNKRNKI